MARNCCYISNFNGVPNSRLVRVQKDGGEAAPDLLSLIYLLAELICENDDDLLWLDRRFAMLYDVLQESRAYQRIKQEGELQALHQTLLAIVETYFPTIMHLATRRTSEIQDPAVLQKLIVKVGRAQT
jgi:hypothetical protein